MLLFCYERERRIMRKVEEEEEEEEESEGKRKRRRGRRISNNSAVRGDQKRRATKSDNEGETGCPGWCLNATLN